MHHAPRRIAVLLCAAIILLLTATRAQAQKICPFEESATPTIPKTDVATLRCMARREDTAQVLAMTFAAWCTPCRAHLPGAIAFARKHKLRFVVLIPEMESDPYTADAARIARAIDSDVLVLVIADHYGSSRNRKYKQFLKDIIPPAFPMIDDYSKYILFDKKGEVIFVSSWKDNRKYNWHVDTAVQNQKILPLLGKK